MRINCFTVYFIFITLLISVEVYAEDAYNEGASADEGYTEDTGDNYEKNKETDETESTNRTLFIFSEGAAVSWLTRIINQTERSNFVFKDFLLGAYLRTEMIHFNQFKPMLRVAVFYPFSTTFNDVPQEPKNPMHLGADMLLGVKFDLFEFQYARINLGVAFHMFYLHSERWNYFNMGAAAFAGIEVPIQKNWTVLINGFASYDNGNLGGNRTMEPFDTVYQYQVDIGVRYSKKFANKTFIFPLGLRDDDNINKQYILR